MPPLLTLPTLNESPLEPPTRLIENVRLGAKERRNKKGRDEYSSRP